MDLSLRTAVLHKDLIKGAKYDLSITIYDNKNTHGHYVWTPPDIVKNLKFSGREKGDSKLRKNNKLIFIEPDGKVKNVDDHPQNKVYRTKTLGDVLSTKNTDKKQSSSALQALTPLYGNKDVMTHSMKYGGKKKRKGRKTLKKKSIKKKRKTKKHVKKSRRIKK